MKILFLTNKPPYPAKDGSSLATLCMAEGLAELGNSITILSISTQKHPCRIEQIPIELRQLINFNLIEVNTKINLINAFINLLFSKLPYNIERFIDSGYTKKLTEILKANRYDIIQLEGLYMSPYIKTIREQTDTPIVYRSHNIEHEIWVRLSQNEANILKSTYYLLLSKRIRRMENSVKHQVNALVAISKRDENWFRSNGFNKPSAAIPMGYSIEKPIRIEGLSNDEPCFLGSLDWIPNQEGLLWFLNEVWPKVYTEFPNLFFHIAGRNAPASIIDRLKKTPNIEYHGEVENAHEYLKRYSILIVPILSGSGMRVKIIEGMIFGKVIVTTTIGMEGIDAINHEHALIVDTPNDFAQAITGLIRQPANKEGIAKKACIFAIEHFNSSKLTKELENFYKQMI
ncbi:MAG: glycosyltransferase [Bacteroidales bacterium]|nr:MAG: glycosyltransferase [Bacteroidales bacterium]